MFIGSKVIGILLSLFLLLSVSPASAAERSFEIAEVAIHASIDSDGSMLVTERDTYRFDGVFHGILVDLNTAGSDGIERFSAYEVSDEGSVPLEFEQSGAGDARQYKVYSESADATKVFQFSYTVKNVVQVYADTAELYWKFFDKKNANSLGAVSLEIELPDGIAKEEITPFGHGPLDGIIQVEEDGTVLFQVGSLPAGQLLEARVLFPANYVLGSKRISDEPMLAEILEQERNWSTPDAGPEHSNDYTVPVALLLLLANLASGFAICIRYRKAPKSDWKGGYYRELPSDASPAVVGFLLHSRIDARNLTATLLDFVRRKYIVMKKLDAPKVGTGSHDYSFRWTNRNAAGLLPHETMLLEWFFDKIGDGHKVALSEIRFEAGLHADFSRTWGEWQDKVKEAAIERNDMRRNPRIYRWVILVFLVQFIGFWFLAPIDWGWLMFCSIPLPFFKPKRYQRTRKGQTDYEKWKAFGRFLRAYSRIEKHDTMDVRVWDQYFVYAIPLGEAQQMIKDIRIDLPSGRNRNDHDPFLYNSTVIYEYDQLIRQIKETVSASEKPAAGDSSEPGGSFSSGGGDGGGGGGRGAF